jgi:hypothetical protein
MREESGGLNTGDERICELFQLASLKKKISVGL